MSGHALVSDRVPTRQEAVILKRLLDHANTHDIAESMFWYRPEADERMFLPEMERAGWAIEWMGTWTIAATAGVEALARYHAASAPGVPA